MQVRRAPTFCFYFKNIILLSKFLDLEVKILSFNVILILFVDFKELRITIDETLSFELSKSVVVLGRRWCLYFLLLHILCVLWLRTMIITHFVIWIRMMFLCCKYVMTNYMYIQSYICNLLVLRLKAWVNSRNLNSSIDGNLKFLLMCCLNWSCFVYYC